MGPLEGVKVIEIAGIGPAPFCAMMLTDMGAEVIRIDRRGATGSGSKKYLLNRGKRSIALDLKTAEGIEAVLKLIEQADAVIEGFRPGLWNVSASGRRSVCSGIQKLSMADDRLGTARSSSSNRWP